MGAGEESLFLVVLPLQWSWASMTWAGSGGPFAYSCLRLMRATVIRCWSVYALLAGLTEKVQRYGGALELRQIRVGFLLALLLFVVGCSSTLSHSGLAEPSVRLADLEDIGELENRFNQDVGLPRLILILSPT